MLGYFSGKSGFFDLACMEVDGVALNPHTEHIVFSKWNMTDLPQLVLWLLIRDVEAYF